MRVLLVLLALGCVALFVAGLVAPRGSKWLQQRYRRLLRRGERKSSHNAGKAGDLTEQGLRRARRAGDVSAEAGRSARGKLPV